MEATRTTAPPEPFRIGPDLVTVTEHQVIIDALHQMADWQVREYARIPIYFQDMKFFLRQKLPGKRPYAMRYMLEPWPEDSNESFPASFSYDEATVAQREAELRTGHLEDLGRAALLIVYPFLGLLWSKTKDRLIRFGFVPRTITGVSIFMTFALFMMQGVFAKMLMMGSMRSGNVVVGGVLRAFAGQDRLNLGVCAIPFWLLDLLLTIALLVDCIIRYHHHLRGEDHCWGFLEWLTCLAPRKKRADQSAH